MVVIVVAEGCCACLDAAGDRVDECCLVGVCETG